MSNTQKITKKGKIYKIIALVNNFDIKDTYYGSTTQKYLSERMSSHRNHYRNHSNIPYSSKILFDKYGLENCYISLLEEIEFNNIDELRRKENEYIMNNDCCNKVKSFLSIEDKKEYNNKYHINHKNVKKEYDIKYRDLNKAKLLKSNICECGGKYKTIHLSCHIKTKKHLDYIKVV
jgi:hypothetical protein